MTQANITSQYPPPPHYYKLYENYDADNNNNENPKLLPPEPVHGTYTVFGGLLSSKDEPPTFDEQRRLYTINEDGSINYVVELSKLTRKLLMKFLELLDILVNKSHLYSTCTTEIENFFFNMHHLLNSYRPHQAKSTIVTLLDNQATRREQDITTMREKLDEVQKILVDAQLKLDQAIQKSASVDPLMNQIK